MLPELLCNCWVTDMLPFLPRHRSAKSTHFKQAELAGGCFQTDPRALGTSSRAPKYPTTTHFKMAPGSEDLGNSLTETPL